MLTHSVLALDESLWHMAHIWHQADGTTRVGTEMAPSPSART
ncbi:hypothetical protein [Streptomyces sp. 4F14]